MNIARLFSVILRIRNERGEEKTKQKKRNAGTTFSDGRTGLRFHLEAFLGTVLSQDLVNLS